MRYDTIIIGSGIAGIAASLVLAGAGRRTLLVERSRRTASTLRGFSRDGVHFDTGLHYLGGYGPGEPLDVYFRHMGLRGLTRAAYDSEGFDRVRFTEDGREHALPSGYDRLRERLGAAFPDERAGLDEYLEAVRWDYGSSPFLDFSRDVDPRALQGSALDGKSLASVLHPLVRSPRLRTLLAVHCLLYGSSPEEAPFLLHAKVAGSYYQSAHGLAGGGRAMANSCDAALAAAGVEVRTGTAATALETGPDGALRALVTADGERYETRQCVFTANPRLLPGLLPGGALRPAFCKRMASLPLTPSAHMLFGVADTPLPELAGSNVIACPPGDVGSYFRPRRGPQEGPFYVSGGCAEDPGAPQAVMVIAPGDYGAYHPWADAGRGARPEGYAEAKASAMDAMRKAALAACPELARVRFVDGATPLTLRDWMGAPEGALYGAKHSVDHFNPQPVTRVSGLYIAGQSVVAPGVLGAVVSAYLACGLILGFEPLWKELRACL